MGSLDDSSTVFFPNQENFIVGVLFLTLSAPLLEVIAVTTWAGFGATIRVFISNNKIKNLLKF